MAAPTFATLLLLLYLCDVLNQHMGWNIPLGLGVVGISTTDDAEKSEDNQSKDAAATTSKSNDIAALTAELERTKKELASARAAASVKVGTAFTIRDLALDMLWVKPGTFTMGSPTSEAGRRKDETQHQVTLTKGFYLGKYEVTQAQWEKVMGSNPSRFKGVNRPVETVTWDDVTSFCEKLTELESKAGRLTAGMAYQLPTEAQWEYACRAGTTTAFSFGDVLTAKDANFDKNVAETTDVGKYPANPWGFHDMHGNVWERCATRDSGGEERGSYRFFSRGGSWLGAAKYARSAHWYGLGPASGGYNSLGFRLSLRPASQ
jgi:formylglycine-generating enzyme required for sulfatase activity